MENKIYKILFFRFQHVLMSAYLKRLFYSFFILHCSEIVNVLQAVPSLLGKVEVLPFKAEDYTLAYHVLESKGLGFV